MTQSQHADNCIFYKHEKKNTEILIIGIYVDDAILAASNEAQISWAIENIQREFEITVNPLSYFLGIHIHVDPQHNIYISQTKYVREILKRFKMENCTPVSTPADSNIYTLTTGPKENISVPYRELIGSIMFLATCTRPDLAFVVGYLSRFLDNPTNELWLAGLRVLRYLKATPSLGIKYSANGGQRLDAFCDSDFASDQTSRKSLSGQIFKLNDGAVIWASSQQKSVSLSTTEAEFIAATEATKSALWIKQLLKELSHQITPIVKVDNQSAIKLIKNPEFHKRTKHIDVRYFFIREKYQNKEVLYEYVPTKNQEADIFTKPLPKPTFRYILSKLNLTTCNEP